MAIIQEDVLAARAHRTLLRKLGRDVPTDIDELANMDPWALPESDEDPSFKKQPKDAKPAAKTGIQVVGHGKLPAREVVVIDRINDTKARYALAAKRGMFRKIAGKQHSSKIGRPGQSS